MSRHAKRATQVGSLTALVGGLVAYAVTGSPQLAVIWSALSVPAPWLFTYFVLHP